MIHRFNPIALQELKSAARYYDSCRAGLGSRFLFHIDAGIRTIAEAPLRWPQLIPGYHKYRIDPFPYGIIYHLIDSDLFEIDAIADLRRRLGYWRERIR